MAYIKKKPEDKLKTGPKPMGLQRFHVQLLKDDYTNLKNMSSSSKLSISSIVRTAIANHLQNYNGNTNL